VRAQKKTKKKHEREILSDPSIMQRRPHGRRYLEQGGI
jgi:hypothetical protein